MHIAHRGIPGKGGVEQPHHAAPNVVLDQQRQPIYRREWRYVGRLDLGVAGNCAERDIDAQHFHTAEGAAAHLTRPAALDAEETIGGSIRNWSDMAGQPVRSLIRDQDSAVFDEGAEGRDLVLAQRLRQG